MQAPVKHILKQHIFWLSSDRAMYWENENTLIISDLHFGKTGHFRKSGIAVPQTVFKEDLQRLIAQVQFFAPKELLVVGDFFHSVVNKELELFRRWRDDLPGLVIKLVKGNHDILKDEWYKNTGITISRDGLLLRGFCFTHDYNNCAERIGQQNEPVIYTISGHIHPAIKVRGLGRQSLCLPCFYFGEEFAVLPAFSRFTGSALIAPKTADGVFAIASNKIVRIQ